jgi:sialate O-acetylesterase
MQPHLSLASLFSWLAVLQAGPACHAAVKPHALISQGMVLQRDTSVPIWGTASENEKVTVRFQGQDVTTTAQNGKWRVRLGDLQAGGPFEMTISGTNTIRLRDVFVGEVWLCSGQSNMVWPVRLSAANEVIAESRNPRIRFFTVPLNSANTPQNAVVANPRGDQEVLTSKIPYTPTWKECRPEVVADISAVGYFFARDLQKALGVPWACSIVPWGARGWRRG